MKKIREGNQMHNSTFTVPVFVIVFLVGLGVCFALGCLQAESVDYRGSKMRRSAQFIDSVLVIAAGFGLGTVVTFLRYSVTLPSFPLWKIGVFGLAILATAFLAAFFFLVAYFASMIPMDEVGEDGRRHHREKRGTNHRTIR